MLVVELRFLGKYVKKLVEQLANSCSQWDNTRAQLEWTKIDVVWRRGSNDHGSCAATGEESA